ncbi:hypothetical protein SDC9_70137 [bioreactor metagenome]|uniref:Uncharacterized protein n=1 Tax=bioreactor metagenome TaxID=1076179 RepID=A0A644YAT1_9ZZZZ
MVKKVVAMVTAIGIIAGGVSTTAYAADNNLSGANGNLKTVIQQFKEVKGDYISNKGVVKAALKNKKAQLLTENKELTKEDFSGLRNTLKDIGREKAVIKEENKTIKTDVKGLKEELKVAREQNNSEKSNTIITSLIEKISKLTENFTKLSGLRTKALTEINQWAPSN